MPEPIYLETLGHISFSAGVSVSEVQRIIDEIGASPLFVIDLVPHFSNEVADTIMAIARNLVGTVAFDRRYGVKGLTALHQQFLAKKEVVENEQAE